MATEWKSQQADGMFYLQFETDNKEKYMIVEKAAQMAIDGKTTADYAVLKHGEWVHRNGEMYCSECGGEALMDEVYYKSPYCPKCGAKMDGRGEQK